MAPFACIFVRDFPVEAALRAEPELRPLPVAMLEGKAPLQRVFAVNEKARQLGIETGMTRLQVDCCSGLAIRTRSLSQETSAHAALLDCAQSFSPQVEDAGCDTILLDLSGLKLLFGSPLDIARGLVYRASDLGLKTVNVAIACNLEAAVLAARGFSGITVIPAGEEAEQLGSLPIEILFTGSSTGDGAQRETLSRWGIRNLRALAALPEIALTERLGQAGLRIQRLARGVTLRMLVPVEPILTFEEAIQLEHPLVLLEPLTLLLDRMLEQLCARLAARALSTQELRLCCELENSQSSKNTQQFTRRLRLPIPLLDSRILLKLLQLDLNAHPPGAPIVSIHLSAEPVRPRAAQNGLFLPPAPEPEKIELTLAKIAGIVGENNIGSVEMLDTHRPQGFSMRRFSLASTKQTRKPEKPTMVIALRVFRPPVVVAVTMREGCPARIACTKRRSINGPVLWTAGPWRSTGDWWEQEPWARDEWDIAVQQEDGIALYRLTRDLLNASWFLEGSYD